MLLFLLRKATRVLFLEGLNADGNLIIPGKRVYPAQNMIPPVIRVEEVVSRPDLRRKGGRRSTSSITQGSFSALPPEELPTTQHSAVVNPRVDDRLSPGLFINQQLL